MNNNMLLECSLLMISFAAAFKSQISFIPCLLNILLFTPIIHIFTDLSLVSLKELHDPFEACLESTGHGGYLCQS